MSQVKMFEIVRPDRATCSVFVQATLAMVDR
jgi:hypothetical protein